MSVEFPSSSLMDSAWFAIVIKPWNTSHLFQSLPCLLPLGLQNQAHDPLHHQPCGRLHHPPFSKSHLRPGRASVLSKPLLVILGGDSLCVCVCVFKYS